MADFNDNNEKYIDDVDIILSQENDGVFEHNVNISRPDVSPAVVKRLPKYFRYLRQLIRQGKTRVSSAELSKMMNFTASQIRQDLNCFGGFGQQGYGYNVNYLFAKISEILGVSAGFKAIIIGAGDLGRALVHLSMFEKRGVDISALFDTGNDAEGKDCAGVPVYPIEELEAFCEENKVDIAVLACPKQLVKGIADRCVKLGLKGLWNYMGVELEYTDEDIVVENVHLGDSLMILNCRICRNENGVRVNDEGEPEQDETEF